MAKSTKAELEALLAQKDKEIVAQAKQIQSLQWALEDEKERWTRLVTEFNGILDVLRKIFAFRVFSKHFDDDDNFLWDAEADDGTILVSQEKDVVTVYDKAIRASLEIMKDK